MSFPNDDNPTEPRNIDLHIHSLYSDGKMSPEKIVKIAKSRRVDVISITDHDTVAGIESAVRAGNQCGIKVIPGIEMGVTYKSVEFHLLGYYFNYKSTKIVNYEKMMRHSRVARAKKIISELDKIGFHITYDLVEEMADGSPIGRPHIAQVLVDEGYVYSIHDAFQNYLGEEKKANVAKEGVGIQEAFDIIKSSGGFTVLAHPITIHFFDELFPILLDAGLDGIESFHPQHHPSHVERYEKLADKNGILKTGGSDCHGSNSDNSSIGTLAIPVAYYQQMQKRLKLCSGQYV